MTTGRVHLFIRIPSIVGLTDSEDEHQGVCKGALDPTNQADREDQDKHPVDSAECYGLGL